MKYWYEIVSPPADVERACRGATMDALAEVELEYVLRPRLTWLRRSTWLEAHPEELDLTGRKVGFIAFDRLIDGAVFPNEIRGSYEPVIYVNAAVTPTRAAYVGKHEIGHVLQVKFGHDQRVSSAELERGADAFARGESHPWTDARADAREAERKAAQNVADVARRVKVSASKLSPRDQSWVDQVEARSREYHTLINEYTALAKAKGPIFAAKGQSLPSVKTITSAGGLATRAIDLDSLRSAVAVLKGA